MKVKPNYIFIPLFVILVSALGSQFTNSGIGSGWYDSLNLPSFTPPGWVIGAVWTAIFILGAISALIVYNRQIRGRRWRWIMFLFVINAAVNAFWSYLFFGQNLIFPAIFDAALIAITVYALIVLIWPISRWASVLLLPYAGWVTFATYLNYVIWTLN